MRTARGYKRTLPALCSISFAWFSVFWAAGVVFGLAAGIVAMLAAMRALERLS